MRVAIGNHRTRDEDLDLFLDTLLELGAATAADLDTGADLTTATGLGTGADLTTSPGASPTAGGTATTRP